MGSSTEVCQTAEKVYIIICFTSQVRFQSTCSGRQQRNWESGPWIGYRSHTTVEVFKVPLSVATIYIACLGGSQYAYQAMVLLNGMFGVDFSKSWSISSHVYVYYYCHIYHLIFWDEFIPLEFKAPFSDSVCDLLVLVMIFCWEMMICLHWILSCLYDFVTWKFTKKSMSCHDLSGVFTVFCRMLAHKFVEQSVGSKVYMTQPKEKKSWWSFGWYEQFCNLYLITLYPKISQNYSAVTSRMRWFFTSKFGFHGFGNSVS